ncbi:MAG: 50S ribosomal protein L19e [Candidatus Thermoplasmatota archaeon]|nr:50S ribosomal protein L19e [Candidatus Thermoplasmatota archaeon]MBS3789856.1 50S ribosomal protein L19e [Candidatus Thermoplasmatota archaeon]
MDIKYQKRLAAEILDCGKDRVWIDDTMLDEVVEAITREEVRELINRGVIRKEPKEGNSRGRINYKKGQKAKGRRKGYGKRRGTKNARQSSKDKWKNRIRSMRRELKHMRDNGLIDRTTYREFYNRSKGGAFEDTADMILHLQMEDYIDEDYEIKGVNQDG